MLLAPLRFGAGLKGKLVEAMQCGTPSVTTSIGAEAMHGNLPWSGSITDSPEVFAQAAIQLYTDKTAWYNKWKTTILNTKKNALKKFYPDILFVKL